MYNTVTVRLDHTGCLNMWKGVKTPNECRTLDCDVFIQSQDDINSIMDSLPVEEQKDIDAGWTIQTNFISDEYFTL